MGLSSFARELQAGAVVPSESVKSTERSIMKEILIAVAVLTTFTGLAGCVETPTGPVPLPIWIHDQQHHSIGLRVLNHSSASVDVTTNGPGGIFIFNKVGQDSYSEWQSMAAGNYSITAKVDGQVRDACFTAVEDTKYTLEIAAGSSGIIWVSDGSNP